MDRLRILRTLDSTPGIFVSLNEALILADALHKEFSKPAKPRLNTHEGRVAFARSLPEVMNELPDRKIHAIKNLRDAIMAIDPAQGGLKECKDAVEAISPPRPW